MERKKPVKIQARDKGDYNYEAFGKYLRMLRQSRGLSQGDVEDFSGIPKTTLRDMELGDVKNPTFLNIIRLSSAYNEPLNNFKKVLMQETPPPSIMHRLEVWYKSQGS